MELYQYKYFIAAAATGSFQVAADKLFVTRQAISQSIILMEKELGYPLFLRTKTGLVLTREGTLFLPRIKNLVSIHEQMEQDMHKCCNKSRRIIRLYYTFTTYNLYEDCLLDFQKHYNNNFLLQITGCQEADCCRLLQEDQADIIISTFIPKFVGCKSKLLAQYPISLMLSEKNKLAQKGNIGLEDLTGETFLAYISGDQLGINVYMPDCILTGVKDAKFLYSDDLIYLFHRVRNNRGILLGVTENFGGLLNGVVFKPFPQAGSWNHYYTVSDSFSSNITSKDISEKFFGLLNSQR